MFTEHDTTKKYATMSSFRATKASKKMVKTIRANREIIPAFDKAVDAFDKTCEKVLNREIIRLEEERLHAEAVAANAGKELDFF